MTDIQVKYWANKETERANRAREAETNRSNLANEKIASDTLNETQRHNQRTEELTASQVAETERSNRAKEGISLLNYQETVRSNKTREAETNRSNLAREAEEKRSNLAKESENRRSNMAREAETRRANQMSEAIQSTKVNSEVMLNASKMVQAQENANLLKQQTLTEAEKTKTESARADLTASEASMAYQRDANYPIILTADLLKGVSSYVPKS